MKYMYLLLAGFLTVPSFAAPAVPSLLEPEDTSAACNFYALSDSQRAAQTQVLQNRAPGLLGPVRGVMTAVSLDGVYITDKAILRKVMAQSVLARRLPSHSIEVIARVVNCTDYPLQILGRTTFLDSNKIETEDPSAWQLVTVYPHSFASYHEVSVSGDEIKNYLIEFRSNR